MGRGVLVIAGGVLAGFLAVVAVLVAPLVTPARPGPPEAPAPDVPLPPAAVAEATPPVPVLPWDAAPDPAPKAAGVPAADVPITLTDTPVFASAGGPFVADAPADLFLPVRVWDLRSGKLAGRFPGRDVGSPGRERPLSHVSALSPDGRTVIDHSRETEVEVWRAGGDEPAATLKVNQRGAFADFVGPDELVTVTAGPPPRVQVWDLTKAAPVRAFTLPVDPRAASHPGTPPAVRGAVSPGGKYLAVADRGQVVVVRLADGKPVGNLPRTDPGRLPRCQSIGFSPDGSELLGMFAAEAGTQAKHRVLGWKLADGSATADFTCEENIPVSTPVRPGPDARTVCVDRVVYDRRTGTPLFDTPYQPVRHLPGDRVLAMTRRPGPPVPPQTDFTKTPPAPEFLRAGLAREEGRRIDQWWGRAKFEPTHPGVGVLPFDRAGYESAAQEAAVVAGGDPPAVPGDRSAIRSVPPPPPDRWAAGPDPAPGPSPAGSVAVRGLPADWGSGPGQAAALHLSGPDAGRAAVVLARYHAKPRPRVSVSAAHIDLRSGAVVGEPARLLPWVNGLLSANKAGLGVDSESAAQLRAGGLSGDGGLLALRHPDDLARVDVWDAAGKRVLGFVPYAADTPVDWVGWSGRRLLTLGGGRLTGWDVPAGRAAFEVAGGYDGPVAPSPARKWVAVPAKGLLDLIDTETGAVLGRLGAGAEGGWIGLDVAADGRRLAGVRQTSGRARVTVWDVSTGAVAADFSVPKLSPPGPVRWHGPGQLLVGGHEVVDLGHRLTVARYLGGLARFAAPGAGGQWWWFGSVAGADAGGPKSRAPALVPVEVPAGGWAVSGIAFGPNVGASVEVACGTAARDAQARAAVTTGLEAAGYPVAASGWRIKVTAEQYDTADKLTREDGSGTEVRIPAVRATAKLIAPDGAVAWEGKWESRFQKRDSRYY